MRTCMPNSLPKLDRQIETVAYPLLANGVTGCLGERGGTGKRGDRVPGLLDVLLAHPSKSRFIGEDTKTRGCRPSSPMLQRDATVCNRRSCAGRFNLGYV